MQGVGIDASLLHPSLRNLAGQGEGNGHAVHSRSEDENPRNTVNSQFKSNSGRKRKASQALTDSLSSSRNDRETMALRKQIESISAQKETNTTLKRKRGSLRKTFEQYSLTNDCAGIGTSSHVFQRRGPSFFDSIN